MFKHALIFSAVQIITVLFSYFILAVGVVGSHGRLNFSNGGMAIAVIVTIVLALPLIYLFIQRKSLKNKRLLFTIATLLFCLAMAAVYIGLPTSAKQFVVDNNNTNSASIYNDGASAIKLSVEKEMFNRVYVEVNISKSNDVEFKNFTLRVFDNNGKVINPVFQPLAWDSIHYETIQMSSFFEQNDYTKMNRFSLSAQYSIENTNSLKIEANFSFIKNGQIISGNKKFNVDIKNAWTLERFIEY